ncbi:hypothetical protein A2954_02505 [Candidatus Roizmanbacteria bacterium RIFCSPLOWO2_01_FULL_37_12]|uniref:Cytidyltransferase-like domain-containing protein n=1 Tax=Candidatus Roizmanbacteria bacterium RIFCSPLOWO2_01_FULL_37_12 TaxID=1802056 RepID=A0A1F7IEW2_9BACT|nr:MAG: hypothetical protein A3D76_00055 [Candidatus Roizmanbacteria bacterium RIFCSPHIGHO2_02_FULL_37_9b]OGK41897.1 MAG: hypothetical protein A2954_02505 [Candidatus Roizmanbacteria bacterium RIFCSPLOWO2_01_FULL_37_12]
MKKYQHIIYAGTFDRLHIGHKKMLERAFELAEKVSIGITSSEMVKDKVLGKIIEKFNIRYSRLEKYLKSKNLLKRATFFKLDDIFGPSIKDNFFDSILVTEWTKSNGFKINDLRLKNNLNPLKIIVEPLVRGNDGEVVTSERIRMGEIDREGHLYGINKYTNKQISNEKKELILPKYLREELRKPLGKVISGSVDRLSETAKEVIKSIKSLKSKVTMTIAVGDIVTKSLIDVEFKPDVSIIDFRSRRQPINPKSKFLNSKQLSKFKILSIQKSFDYFNLKHLNLFRVSNLEFRICQNQPGTINLETSNIIKKTVKKYLAKRKKSLILVKGEEDLLALPAILFAPLDAVVLYGQIDMGVVMVEVTEERKKEVKRILRKFQ